MTVRNGSADWRGDIKNGSGTVTVGNGVFHGAAGHVSESLHTNAVVHLRNINGAPTLARLDIDTEGHVAGVDEQQFQHYAEQAKANCPVARALAGIPEIVLTAKLAVAAQSQIYSSQ